MRVGSSRRELSYAPADSNRAVRVRQRPASPWLGLRGRGFAVASTSTALLRALGLYVLLFLFRRCRSISAARARPGTNHAWPWPPRQPVSNRRPAAKIARSRGVPPIRPAGVPVLRSHTDHGLGARTPSPPVYAELFIRRPPASPGTSAPD